MRDVINSVLFILHPSSFILFHSPHPPLRGTFSRREKESNRARRQRNGTRPASGLTLSGSPRLINARRGAEDLVAEDAVEPERLLEGVEVAERDEVGDSSFVNEGPGRDLAGSGPARAAGVFHADPPPGRARPRRVPPASRRPRCHARSASCRRPRPARWHGCASARRTCRRPLRSNVH